MLKRNQNKIVFSVNPKQIEVTRAQLSKKQELLSGDYITIGGSGLATVRFSTFIPHSDSIFFNEGQMMNTVQIVENWRRSKAIVTFVLGGVGKMDGYITELSRSFTEGDRDEGVTITFSERRKLEIKKLSNEQKVKEQSRSAYTVKPGEDLYRIALIVYGNAVFWRNLYDANKRMIGSDPMALRPGMKLKIPRLNG